MIIDKSNVNIENIKLIIWDLDNTFWKGIISEEKIKPNKNLIEFVKHATDRGIVNSICSKNDFEECRKQLTELNIWEYFVFPSIEWSLKGQRLFEIIKDMGLRPVNTLFIDDEELNLQNALSIDSSLLCAFPDNDFFLEMEKQLLRRKLDKNNEKLKQYKTLEIKQFTKKKYADDLEFLRNAGIRISINDNCIEELDRIHELINKTNQLNFTKIRLSIDETKQLLLDQNFECKYITCKDKFGVYGLIGFYALDKKNNELVHYLFSCRTIGMGIETYVYKLLNMPKIVEVAPVTIHFSTTTQIPDWIIVENSCFIEKQMKSPKVLFKGPCDLSSVVPFLIEKVSEEFTYVSNVTHRRIEAHNHTISILQALELDDLAKNFLYNTLDIIDNAYFSTTLFEKKYDFFVYSLLVDYGLGLYQNKNNPDIIIPYAQYTLDITDEKNWDKFMYGEYRAEVPLTKEFLQYFRDNYKFIGRISSEQLINNVLKIRAYLPKETVMVLVNGSEIEYNGKTLSTLAERHILHAQLNSEIRDVVSQIENCFLIEVSDLVKTSDNYTDTLNHYKKVVYYNIAKEINKIISSLGYRDLEVANESFLQKCEKDQERAQFRNKVKKIVVKTVGYRGLGFLRKILKKR